MRISRELLILVGGVLLLTLDANAVQQQPTAPQTGSGVGPATSSSAVATPPNASGAGPLPEELKDDQAMLPKDGDEDQTQLPKNATDTPAASDGASPSSARAPADVPAPAAVTNARAMVPAGTSEGCWARLYDAENFIGRNVTLMGPAEMPDMQGSFRSIEVGPNATVILFNEDHFANETGRFAAGTRAANLREPGTSDEFESLQLTCAQPVAR